MKFYEVAPCCATRERRGMLVLLGGLLVVSFLYFVSVMRRDEDAQPTPSKLEDSSQTSSSPDEGNVECGQSTRPEYVCSRCGSRPETTTRTTSTAIKIEEETIEESTTTSTYEILEEKSYESLLRYYNDERRVPFPEAGVDIVDRKLKNTDESLDEEMHKDEDDVLTYTESWTENWLFRKKDDDNTRENFKPVSMFVPRTTAKYRAMIGDRDVDEMSELTDCSNDEEEEDDEGEEEEEATEENGVAKYIYDRRARLLLDGVSKHHREHNIVVANGYCRSDEENDENRNSLDEKSDDAESNRSYRSELFIETFCSSDVNHNSTPLQQRDDKLSDIDFNLFSPPKPGTIADREHRKWEQAAPMENNPYSEANLQRRLLERKYAPKYSSASSLLGLGGARINGFDDGAAVSDGKCSGVDIDFETIDLPEKSSIFVEEDKSAEKSNDSANKDNDKDDSDEDGTKNKSRKSNGVTKKNAMINEVVDSMDEEKITLPSVRKLVEVFTAYQRARRIYVEPKDKNTSESKEEKMRIGEQPQQHRPLHLHSLTARSLSKEFREGLR